MKALALLTAVAVTLFSAAASAQTSEHRTARAKLRRRRLLPKARRASNLLATFRQGGVLAGKIARRKSCGSAN